MPEILESAEKLCETLAGQHTNDEVNKQLVSKVGFKTFQLSFFVISRSK